MAKAGALQGTGSPDEPDAGGPIYLWPENIHAWHCWLGVQTQWRYLGGAGGATRTGLCYAGVAVFLADECPEPLQRRQVFECIRAAELACLAQWAHERDQDAKNTPPQR